MGKLVVAVIFGNVGNTNTDECHALRPLPIYARCHEHFIFSNGFPAEMGEFSRLQYQ